MDLKTYLMGLCPGCGKLDKYPTRTPLGTWRCDECRTRALPFTITPRRNTTLKTTIAVIIGLALAGVAGGSAEAQWQYPDGKGGVKVTQYKADVPADLRDAAVFVGKTGVGNPALSAEMNRRRALEDADRRIIEAEAKMLKYGEDARNRAAAQRSAAESKPLVTMCVAGEHRVMVSPGHWTVIGQCRGR